MAACHASRAFAFPYTVISSVCSSLRALVSPSTHKEVNAFPQSIVPTAISRLFGRAPPTTGSTHELAATHPLQPATTHLPTANQTAADHAPEPPPAARRTPLAARRISADRPPQHPASPHRPRAEPHRRPLAAPREPPPAPAAAPRDRPPINPVELSDSETPPPSRYTLASAPGPPAALAQSAERLTRNEKVVGSIPTGGSTQTPRSEASSSPGGFVVSGSRGAGRGAGGSCHPPRGRQSSPTRAPGAIEALRSGSLAPGVRPAKRHRRSRARSRRRPRRRSRSGSRR